MQFDEFYFYIISRSCETKEEKVSRFSVTTMIVERTNGSSIIPLLVQQISREGGANYATWSAHADSDY